MVEALGFVLDAMTAAGTLALAVFAFLEIRSGAWSRRVGELESDTERVLDQEGGYFLRDLRATILRWDKDPRLADTVRRMLRRHDARIARFKEEMRELRGRLVDLRKELVEHHPGIGDGGSLVLPSEGTTDPNNLLTLRRFDELTSDTARHPQDGEWPAATVLDSPPGTRDPYEEEPAPEVTMLRILEARFARLRQLERLGQLSVAASLHGRFHSARLREADVVGRLVDWKQNSAEAALYEITVFVEAMNPSYIPHADAEPTGPDLSDLRWHLADHDYWEAAANPPGIDEIDGRDRAEILEVVDVLKQRLRAAVRGIGDDLRAAAYPSGAHVSTLIHRALAYGSRNVDRKGRE